jgi:hypothetical protein
MPRRVIEVEAEGVGSPGDPFISYDRRELYFAAPGPRGAFDLWVSRRSCP